MAIPVAALLGLACTFYVYVAVRWWREAMLMRREGKRSSRAMVLLFAGEPEDGMAARSLQDNEKYDACVETRETWDGSKDVIVMGRTKAGKQEKRVVA